MLASLNVAAAVVFPSPGVNDVAAVPLSVITSESPQSTGYELPSLLPRVVLVSGLSGTESVTVIMPSFLSPGISSLTGLSISFEHPAATRISANTGMSVYIFFIRQRGLVEGYI